MCGARLSQQWSGACLSCTLGSGGLHPPGSLDECLGSTDGECEFAQGPVCGWSRSADAAVLVMCAVILGVSLPDVSSTT